MLIYDITLPLQGIFYRGMEGFDLKEEMLFAVFREIDLKRSSGAFSDPKARFVLTYPVVQMTRASHVDFGILLAGNCVDTNRFYTMSQPNTVDINPLVWRPALSFLAHIVVLVLDLGIN